MALSPIQTAHASYSLTAADILNGFASIPLTWPEPFADTDYDVAWAVQDLTAAAPSLNFGVGDFHYKAITGITAVVSILAAIPLVQGQADYPLLTTAKTFSYVAPVSTLYMVTCTAWTLDSTANTSADLVFEWTTPGGAQNANTANWLTGPVSATPFTGGDTFSFSTYLVAGTTVTVGTTNLNKTFPYGMSIRVVQMPSNSVLPLPGSVIEVEAVAIHN